MKRRTGGEAVEVRAVVRARYAARLARYSGRAVVGGPVGSVGYVDGHAVGVLKALDAGEPVVLAWWELAGFVQPATVPGVGAHYRVDPDGSVVEVVARRDPVDPLSIVGWDVVPPGPGTNGRNPS